MDMTDLWAVDHEWGDLAARLARAFDDAFGVKPTAIGGPSNGVMRLLIHTDDVTRLIDALREVAK